MPSSDPISSNTQPQPQTGSLKDMAQPYIDKAKELGQHVRQQVEPYYEQYVPENVKVNLEKGLQTANKFSTDGYQFAKGKVSESIEYGRVVIDGATTTITAHTPAPILKVVNDAVEQAKHLREDPVGTVKHAAEDLKTKVEPYVPTFVFNYGNKTYEVVQNTAESLRNNTGVVVERVNGAIERVIEIPQVHAVIDQLKALIAPVTNELFPPQRSEDEEPMPAFLTEETKDSLSAIDK